MPNSNNLLKHKCALITGASSGIGKAIAIDLAKSGVTALHLVGRNEVRLQEVVGELEPYNTTCYTHILELSDTSKIEDFCHTFKTQHSNLDLLIHSAGIVSLGNLEESNIQDLDNQYAINLRAPFLITQKLLPSIKESKGDILFINSGAGLEAGANWSQYAATKHGLKALADALRKEVKKDGVRVISVYPGRTATAMQEQVYDMEKRDDYDAKLLIQPQDISKQVITTLSLSNAATVTDVRVSS